MRCFNKIKVSVFLSTLFLAINAYAVEGPYTFTCEPASIAINNTCSPGQLDKATKSFSLENAIVQIQSQNSVEHKDGQGNIYYTFDNYGALKVTCHFWDNSVSDYSFEIQPTYQPDSMAGPGVSESAIATFSQVENCAPYQKSDGSWSGVKSIDFTAIKPTATVTLKDNTSIPLVLQYFRVEQGPFSVASPLNTDSMISKLKAFN